MSTWDERYARGENAGETPMAMLAERAPQWTPGQALDLACGAGRHAAFLARLGWTVTAVDASEAGLALLRTRCNVKVVRADLERHEYVIEPDAWDLIVMTHYLQRDLYGAIREGVKRGGYFAGAVRLVDERAGVKPGTPAFLAEEGELPGFFPGWERLHHAVVEPPVPARRWEEWIARKV
jgi:SAM-dependent methyltransferase